jgi:rhamnose utilization protein RhaD (predicted bifunctional aldolase and dehydrogenase)
MTITRWDPARVDDDLVGLSRRLGKSRADQVILAEGNTSKRLSDGLIAVKASGASLANATHGDFVLIDPRLLMELVGSVSCTQEVISEALQVTAPESEGRRASIEAIIHAVVQTVHAVRYVAHTHPTDVVAVLSSPQAESAFVHPAYSDEAVVLGETLFVPYAQPGLELGRLFAARLAEYWGRLGRLPSLVLLQNHGIVAISDTVDGIESICGMAVKAARVRLGAYAAGGLVSLPEGSRSTYLERTEIAERRSQISGVAR